VSLFLYSCSLYYSLGCICRCSYNRVPVLEGFIFLDVSMLVNKLWGIKSSATEFLRDGKHSYIAVLPGALRGSFTILPSPPQCAFEHSALHLGLGGPLTLLAICRCYPHLRWGRWRFVSGKVNNVYMGWYVSLGHNSMRWFPTHLWSQRPYNTCVLYCMVAVFRLPETWNKRDYGNGIE
jgi:hypothetical protein